MKRPCKLFIALWLLFSCSSLSGEIQRELPTEMRIIMLKRNMKISENANMMKPYMDRGDRPFIIFADAESSLKHAAPSYDFRILYPIGADEEYYVDSSNAPADINAVIGWIEIIIRDEIGRNEKGELRVSAYKQEFDENGKVKLKYLTMLSKTL